MKYIFKEKVALIFITFYFSLLSDILLDLFSKNSFEIKHYIVYGSLALLSFLFYRYIGKYNEETTAHEFFSSMFAIAFVFFFITIFDPSYAYWVLGPCIIFLWVYPFLYLNKCCISLSQWYKQKRETSKRFRSWTTEPYDIKDTKRTFNFDNVYIGVLVTTIMYLSQLYTDLNNLSIPMFFVYVFYLSYIFIYLLFMGGHIQKKTFPAVDLMIVLLISIFYVMASSYFLTNEKNKSKKSKLCIEYKIGNDKDYFRSSKTEEKMMRDNTIKFIKYSDYTPGHKNDAKPTE